MNNLIFAKCDIVKLAKEYGTPLYVMSENKIVENIREIKNSFDNKYERCKTYFAAKSFLSKDMIRTLIQEDICLDVVSAGELFLAKSLNFTPDKIAFHGNAKTDFEIEQGVEYNVGKFVCDSMSEIKVIDEYAKKSNKLCNILIRVTPGIESNTHEYISTANIDSKFGVPLQNIKESVELCQNLKNIDLLGFHFHVGSQLLDNKSHLLAVDIMLNLIKEVKEDLGFETKVLDLGGGFGIKYIDGDNPLAISSFIDPMYEKIEYFCAENHLFRPNLVIEPGRMIVGEAGITLYTIVGIKEIPNVRVYASIDGGFPDNPRPALYHAVYDAVIANKMNEELTNVVTIAGKCCESGDILIKDLHVPDLERGDILAVKSTGAYNYSMASTYNKNPIPAVVIIKDGVPRVSVKRQTFDELFVRDM